MNALIEAQNIAEQKNRKVQNILNENRSWKSKYKALCNMLESADPKIQERAKTTLQIMENQAIYIEGLRKDPRLEATFSANLGQLVPRVIDLVRVFYPNLIAHTLVDVQSMDRQNGEIFIVKPVFTNTAAGVTAGQQVFKDQTDGTYASETRSQLVGTGNGGTAAYGPVSLSPTPVRTGSLTVTAGSVTGTDDGAGNITGTGITSGTIDYSTGALSITFSANVSNGVAITAVWSYDSEQAPTNIRSLEIQLSLLPVTAQPHPLNVRWSTQAQLAASSHLDLDIPDVLTNLVGSFIKQERDVLLVNKIVAAATADSNLNFDATAPTNYSKLAKYAEIELKLNYGESAIQASMGRGGVSWILAGNNAADIWRNVSGFEASNVVAPIGPHQIGTLRDGTVAVIKVPTMNTNTYVIGFKGYVVGDAATILAEWIPLYASPVFQSYDLNQYAGMMSLYALVMNQTGYYLKGTISSYAA